LVLYIQSMATQHRCAELVAFPMDDSVEVAHELELHVTLALRLTLRYASSKKHISHSPKWFFDQVVAVATKDDRGRSQLSYECTFPEHLCTPSDKELQSNGSSNDDDPSVHFRRLFGFSDNGHGT
ncbi:hypothetical protein DYB38_008830, partial [Aphanomyces astaci]